MNWFGYVWIGILIIAYIIWTVKCVWDFITDAKGFWKLSFCFKNGASWAWWIMLHIIGLLISSVFYFCYYLK